jgi:hypothetical protein
VKALIVDKGDFATPFSNDSFTTLRKDTVKGRACEVQTVGWQAHCSSRVHIHVLSNAGKNIVIHSHRLQGANESQWIDFKFSGSRRKKYQKTIWRKIVSAGHEFTA